MEFLVDLSEEEKKEIVQALNKNIKNNWKTKVTTRIASDSDYDMIEVQKQSSSETEPDQKEEVNIAETKNVSKPDPIADTDSQCSEFSAKIDTISDSELKKKSEQVQNLIPDQKKIRANPSFNG